VGAVDTPTVEIQPVIGDRILETENSRLTFENAMLRQRCHEATAAVHQASAAAATMASMAQVATVPLTMPGGCYSVQVPVLTPNYTNVTPMALDEFALALPRFGLYPPVYVAHPGLQATMPTPVLAAAAYGQDWRAVEQPINDADAANSMAPRRSSQEPTTLMLRNLPNDYTRAMCLKLFDDAGFTGQYDFFYLPIDFKSNCGLGYAFVNLIDSPTVGRFWKIFEGFNAWQLPSQKVLSVRWSSPLQGFEAHVERFRNSPVMHAGVPDEHKPVVFSNGSRVPFPAPTKTLQAPRARQGRVVGAVA
jgi:hypothetical protein